jgi:hypothetical protein
MFQHGYYIAKLLYKYCYIPFLSDGMINAINNLAQQTPDLQQWILNEEVTSGLLNA